MKKLILSILVAVGLIGSAACQNTSSVDSIIKRLNKNLENYKQGLTTTQEDHIIEFNLTNKTEHISEEIPRNDYIDLSNRAVKSKYPDNDCKEVMGEIFENMNMLNSSERFYLSLAFSKIEDNLDPSLSSDDFFKRLSFIHSKKEAAAFVKKAIISVEPNCKQSFDKLVCSKEELAELKNREMQKINDEVDCNLTWQKFALFGENDSYTGAQKQSVWEKQFFLKKVIWEGTLDNVDIGLFGPLVYIDLKDEFHKMTVQLSLANNNFEKEKCLKLNKGQKVRFYGMISQYSNFLGFSCTLANARLLQD